MRVCWKGEGGGCFVVGCRGEVGVGGVVLEKRGTSVCGGSDAIGVNGGGGTCLCMRSCL